jgi:hypothetical protein
VLLISIEQNEVKGKRWKKELIRRVGQSGVETSPQRTLRGATRPLLSSKKSCLLEEMGEPDMIDLFMAV